jgi:predicted secreted hydrolase
MLYLMRDLGGGADPYSSGTLVDLRGRTRHLRAGDFHVEVLDHWRSVASGATYPSKWRITIPSAGWGVTVAPTVPDQELRTTNSTGLTYYEGSTRVSGKAGGRNATGKGYVEMTGYGE